MKPREWWLDFGKRINGECVALSEPPSILNKNILIHVVEYSALEKVRKELDELTREREAAKVLREALNDIVRESSTWDLFAQCALKEADEILEGDESE